MTGLTEKAGGGPPAAGRDAEEAHQRWEASMLRQLETLRAEVRAQSPETLVARCGARSHAGCLSFNYWSRPVSITWPALEPEWTTEGAPCSIFDCAMFLYYLRTADGAPLADRWIGFRDLPAGSFYNQAFQGYSGDRLARAFGAEPGAFDDAASSLAGLRLPALAEHAFAFQPLPRIRLAAVLWPGDDEFPSRASVLFDAAASHYMTTDGLALLGSGLTGRMEKARRA